ncbi:protein of unknown function [Shewanella benthica]|uniref:Uncharacterized protein n=1 Tax=Shewanella benthica TaxID=43661 RepID=A0A330LXQ2_9GAMM|nr:protein of unknown function [Shewanella benthica]
MSQKGITISSTMRLELKALRGSELIINLMELVLHQLIPAEDYFARLTRTHGVEALLEVIDLVVMGNDR